MVLNEEVKSELESLNELFRDKSLLPSKKLDGRVWKIELKNGEAVFMGLPHCSPDDHVVHVDPDMFYKHWLKSRMNWIGGDCVPRDKMPQNIKFNDAVEGFSRGQSDPVPLAEAYVTDGGNGIKDCIDFVNGVTRTFWLISNGAKSFPMTLGSRQEAQELFDLVGIGEGPIPICEL